MTTADRIRKRRIELGMTQEELAKKMKLSGKSAVSKIESAGNYISMKQLERYADGLECSIAYLWGITDDPTPRPGEMERRKTRMSKKEIVEAMKTYSLFPNDQESHDLKTVEFESLAAEDLVPDKVQNLSIKSLEPEPKKHGLFKKRIEHLTRREELLQAILNLEDRQVEDVLKYTKFIQSNSKDEGEE